MKFVLKDSALMATLVLLFTVNVAAFWRMPCTSRSGLARIDPLVSFDSISEHQHAIHGSSGFSSTSTWADLVAADCTSCQVAQDKSAYWTPALYFQDANTKKYQLVTQEGGMLAYYLLYPNANDPTNTVHAFPEGFQMIAGDNYQRNFTYPVPDIQKSLWTGEFTTQAFLRQAAVGFNCLNYAIAPEGSLYRHFLPDKAYLDANCKDGVRFELMFPSCWNGKNDTLTHKNHVAYPSEVMTGNCPPDYPLRLVSLFYETIWRTEDFIGKDGQFIIANGDPTGYGYHGDFIMGWNQTFLQQAVDQCRNPSGRIEDCPVFDIQSSDVYSTCSIKEPPALASETATAGLDTLPGNPAIAYGPAYAQGSTAGSPSTKSRPSSSLSFAPFGTSATVPTLSHSAGSSLASSATYVPGAVFDEVRSSSSASAAPAAVITPAPPAPAVVEQAVSQSYFSTDYHTSGLTVNEVLWVEDVVTVSVPSAPTNSAAAVTGRKKRHLHKHRGVGV